MELLKRSLFLTALLAASARAGQDLAAMAAQAGTDPLRSAQAAQAAINSAGAADEVFAAGMAGVSPQALNQIQAAASSAFSGLASDPKAMAAAAQMGVTPAQLKALQTQTSQAVQGLKTGNEELLRTATQGAQQMMNSPQGQQIQQKAANALGAIQAGETDMKKIAGQAGVGERQFGQFQRAAGSTFDKVNSGVDSTRLAGQTGLDAGRIDGARRTAGNVMSSFAGGESDVRNLAGQAGVSGRDFDSAHRGLGKALSGDGKGAAQEFQPLAERASPKMTPEQLAEFCRKAREEGRYPARCRKKAPPPPSPAAP